jgi:hypothetical protein
MTDYDPSWEKCTHAGGKAFLFINPWQPSTKVQHKLLDETIVKISGYVGPFFGAELEVYRDGIPDDYTVWRYINRKLSRAYVDYIALVAYKLRRAISSDLNRLSEVHVTCTDGIIRYGYEFHAPQIGGFFYGVPLTNKPLWWEINLKSMMLLAGHISDRELKVIELTEAELNYPKLRNLSAFN